MIVLSEVVTSAVQIVEILAAKQLGRDTVEKKKLSVCFCMVSLERQRPYIDSLKVTCLVNSCNLPNSAANCRFTELNDLQSFLYFKTSKIPNLTFWSWL